MIRVAAAMMALLVCRVTTAATINVPADYTTIQAAVDATSNGDEIIVAPGTYTGTGDEVMNTLGKAITLRASGTPEQTILAGEGARRVVQCSSGEGADTVIEGFTITGGSASSGGGINCSNSSPTITGCTISNNTATSDRGGGIYCESSSPTITGCTISDNTANDDGGGIYCSSSSNPTLTNTMVCGNTPDPISGPWTDGGGVCVAYYCTDSDDDGILDECDDQVGDGIHEVPSEFEHIAEAVAAANDGDTVLVAPGTYTGTGNWVINPLGKAITIRATGTAEETIIDGEGARLVVVCNSGEGADTVIEGFTITGGSTYQGGGIYCWGSNPTITGCTISDNTSSHTSQYFGNGGGIYCSGGSYPFITDCTISDNTASSNGGGIYCSGGSYPFITDCTISDNTAYFSGHSSLDSGGGGGIFCGNSSPTITGCAISGNNSASGSIYGGTGGGIYCWDSSPTITDCTISDNTASSNGGGIWCLWDSSPTLTDTAVCENAPDNISGSWTDGGGVCLATSCTDSDDDGILDECDDQVGDGIHEVPSEFEHIAEAVAAANDGDTVLVAPGTYTGTGDWVINPLGKAITIRATGTAEETIIDGEGARLVVLCNSGEGADTVIEGFTITGGSTYQGGGIYCWGSNPTITGCTISDNTADYGGGIYCSGGSYPFITDCTIANNTASVLGGGVGCDTGSNAIISNTTVCGNSPNQISGPYSDEGGNSIGGVCEVPCDADTSGDGSVDGTDLTMIISLWGLEIPSADIDGDGFVDVGDLLILLENWGPCP